MASTELAKSPVQGRRWFQFSLRTFLLLILFVSFPLGWLAIRVERANGQKQAVSALRQFPGIIRYDFQFDSPTKEPEYPSWAAKLLGDDFFADVEFVCLGGREKFTDTELAHVRDLPGLKVLKLSGASITDEGLRSLTSLNELEDLSLANTSITDKGLGILRNLSQLKKLHLYKTNITDDGLAHLQSLTNLRYVHIKKTPTTEEGVRKLQAALPECEVVYEFTEKPARQIPPVERVSAK